MVERKSWRCWVIVKDDNVVPYETTLSSPILLVFKTKRVDLVNPGERMVRARIVLDPPPRPKRKPRRKP